MQVLCLQELFYGPYFCAEQSDRWYDITEPIPDGPTIRLMMETAKRLGMVMIVPVYEVDLPGVYYNSAAVIDDRREWLLALRIPSARLLRRGLATLLGNPPTPYEGSVI